MDTPITQWDAQGNPIKAPQQTQPTQWDAQGNPITVEAPTPQSKQQAAPPPMDPGLAQQMLKAGINAKMIGVAPSVAYENADAVDQALRAHVGDYDAPLDPTIMNDIKVGFQDTIFGLHHREKLADNVHDQGKIDKFVQGLATMVGDAPWYLVGGAGGGAAGAAAGSEAPVVGNITVGAIGAGAGAFALPAAMREQLVLGIQEGDVKSFKDLTRRAAKTLWAGAKGAITGAATEVAGGLPVGKLIGGSAVGSIAAKGLYQATAITTVGDLLDGKVPNADDFAKNAALIVPLSIVTHGVALRGERGKQAVMDAYVKNGTTPEETADKLAAQPPVKPDPPPGLVPAIQLSDQHLEANDGESHAEFSARALGQKPVEMEDLEADPKLADKVLRQPEIHDQPVIDKAWELKKAAIENGEKHFWEDGDPRAELGPPDNIASLYNRGDMKSGRGFSTPDGQFLTREEAEAWVKKNQPDVHEMWKENVAKGPEFHSEDYLEAKNLVQARDVAEGEPDYSAMGPELAKALKGSREYLNTLQASDKATGFGKSLLRTLWVGPRNMLRAEGEQLIGRLGKIVPEKLDQEAISFMRDYSDDPQLLRDGIDILKEGGNEKLKAFIPAMERALNPSDEMKAASDQLTEYFKKALSRSQQLGIFSSSIDPARYSPRMFQKALADEEAGGIQRSGKFTPKTANSIERKYEHILDALDSGETEAQTFNALDQTSIYADRHATAVATKLFITQLKNSEVGKFGTGDEHPSGWVPLSPGRRSLEQNRVYIDKNGEAKIASKQFYVPKAIADAMKPILEDSGTSQIGKALHLQSITKGLELGLSVFHMKAMTVTAMNNMSIGDFVRSMHSDNSSPEFEAAERDGALYGLETTKTGPQYEAYKGLQGGTEAKGLGRLAKAPVVKQVDAFAKKITDETFNVIQRKFKVQDFSLKKAAWEAKHPDATPAEHGASMRGIAKEVNAAYGGLNWEVMGVSKGMQDFSRMILLAPDWTFSNVANLKYAGEGGPAGSAARSFWLKSFITGFGMSAAASIAIGGKYDITHPAEVYLGEDKDGKKMYTSMFFAGAPKDAIHLAQRVIAEKSAVLGLAEVIAGKSGPGLGVLFGLAGNKDYAGRTISKKGEDFRDVDAAKFIAEKALPISGVSTAQTIAKALTDPNHEYSYRDILELAADAAGSPVYHEGEKAGGGPSRDKVSRSEGRSKPRYSALRR